MSFTKETVRDAVQSLGELLIIKNEAYGDSAKKASDILRVLYPDGVTPDQYSDMLLVVRVLDKLSRVAHRKDALGENPWQDIAGYGMLGVLLGQREMRCNPVAPESHFRVPGRMPEQKRVVPWEPLESLDPQPPPDLYRRVLDQQPIPNQWHIPDVSTCCDELANGSIVPCASPPKSCPLHDKAFSLGYNHESE